MRIRNIIRESFFKPFKEYKSFLIVFLLGILCEQISKEFFSLNIGQLSVLLMIFTSLLNLVILGVMISVTNNAVYNTKVEYFNVVENFLEGFKEYIINMYYTILSFLLSTFFIIPSGVYSKLLNIHQYVANMDINRTILTIHEISNEIPISLQLDLIHSIQLNLLFGIIIFVVLVSFGFIGKIILAYTGNMKKALNIKYVFMLIKKIGFRRYVKFLAIFAFITILLFNVLWSLKYFLDDILISAFMEAFVLFFATNSFYLIISENK